MLWRGALCPRFLCYPCHHCPSSSNRATALAMLDVVTPTCRAISAMDNPNSSKLRFAINARRLDIWVFEISLLLIFLLPLYSSIPGHQNPIFRFGFSSASSNCRIASNTTWNCSSYFDSIASIFLRRSSCVANICRSCTKALTT